MQRQTKYGHTERVRELEVENSAVREEEILEREILEMWREMRMVWGLGF